MAETTRTLPSLRVGLLLLDRFTLAAFGGFIDALRLAADDGGQSRQIHASWQIMTPGASKRSASCGLEVSGTSDFLDPVEETIRWLDPLAGRGVRAHLIEVSDPAEETFPYAGRTEFEDPETGQKLTAGRAETLSGDYRRLYAARREALAAWCGRLGWSYTVSRTDRLASETLVKVHMAMTVNAGSGGGR